MSAHLVWVQINNVTWQLNFQLPQLLDKHSYSIRIILSFLLPVIVSHCSHFLSGSLGSFFFFNFFWWFVFKALGAVHKAFQILEIEVLVTFVITWHFEALKRSFYQVHLLQHALTCSKVLQCFITNSFYLISLRTNPNISVRLDCATILGFVARQ